VLALGVILLALATGTWIASRLPAPERRNLDAIVTVAGDAVRDVIRPVIDLTALSNAEEIRLGEAIDAEIRARMTLGGNPAMQAYVDEIVAQLAAGAERREIPYRAAIVAAPDVNAFAVAGGRVYVSEGMLEFVESEAELAAVLGHEIAHVDRRHCVRALQVGQAAGEVAPELGDLARLGYRLLELGFSEEQELEADVAGVLLAAGASYDPWASVSLFQRLHALDPRAGRRPTRDPVVEVLSVTPELLGRYFATHPPTDLRLEAIHRTLSERPDTWLRRTLYVGRGNLEDRRSVHTDPRPAESITREDAPEWELGPPPAAGG
jgi:predicted Zn-dependent protease